MGGRQNFLGICLLLNKIVMKLLKSFGFAINGLIICVTTEANFKIHFLLAAIAIFFGIGLHISGTEWLAVVFSIAFVTAMEMINTAIEKLCDVVHKDIHLGIKKVKDIAAGAVMLAAACSLIVAAIIFLPKIIGLIK